MRLGFSFINGGLVALTFLFAGCLPQGNRPPGSVSGTIETDQVRVASRYGGRVQRLFVTEGEALTNGQAIAELDAAELAARHDQAAAQLAELQAGPRAQEIESARHDWEALQTQTTQAGIDAKRANDLFEQKAISATEHDQTVSRWHMLEGNVAAAKSRYELLLAGTRAERITQARAELAEIDTHLREMKVAAPSDSVVEVLGVKVGDVLSPNQEIATLLLTNHLWVRVYVPEPWLGRIQVGDKVKVSVDSDPNVDFSGAVEQIARAAEFTPRNVQTVDERIKQVFGIKVRLDNPDGKLRAGMAADVTFPNVAGKLR